MLVHYKAIIVRFKSLFGTATTFLGRTTCNWRVVGFGSGVRPVPMETRCCQKSLNFEDTRHKISVPLAMSTNLNLEKKLANLKKKKKKNADEIFGKKIGLR